MVWSNCSSNKVQFITLPQITHIMVDFPHRHPNAFLNFKSHDYPSIFGNLIATTTEPRHNALFRIKHFN